MARRALLKLTSPQTMSNPSAAVAWDVAIEDTSSFFSSGNPTRLTVGPNISAVRLYGGAYMTSAVGEPGGIYLQKNGAPFYGAAAQRRSYIRSTMPVCCCRSPARKSPWSRAITSSLAAGPHRAS